MTSREELAQKMKLVCECVRPPIVQPLLFSETVAVFESIVSNLNAKH